MKNMIVMLEQLTTDMQFKYHFYNGAQQVCDDERANKVLLMYMEDLMYYRKKLLELQQKIKEELEHDAR